jgi:hypothetical protein
MAGVQLSVAAKILSIFHNAQTRSEGQLVSYPRKTENSLPGQSGKGVKLTIHLHPVVS